MYCSTSPKTQIHGIYRRCCHWELVGAVRVERLGREDAELAVQAVGAGDFGVDAHRSHTRRRSAQLAVWRYLLSAQLLSPVGASAEAHDPQAPAEHGSRVIFFSSPFRIFNLSLMTRIPLAGKITGGSKTENAGRHTDASESTTAVESCESRGNYGCAETLLIRRMCGSARSAAGVLHRTRFAPGVRVPPDGEPRANGALHRYNITRGECATLRCALFFFFLWFSVVPIYSKERSRLLQKQKNGRVSWQWDTEKVRGFWAVVCDSWQ